ncbi:MAG: hypothetical protein IKX78_03180, partial [Clostridia bacterium]|nr:hypothetical protein [Clostridia bacterium]
MKNLVFIGNSLITTNSVTEAAQSLFTENGIEINVFACKKGGYTLSRHEADFEKGDFASELAAADIVVLQEYGTDYFPTRSSVEKIIKRIKNGAEVYFLLTEWDVGRNRVNELRSLPVRFIPSGYIHDRAVKEKVFDYDDLHLPGDYHPSELYGKITAAAVYLSITGKFPEKYGEEVEKAKNIITEETDIQQNLKKVLVVGGGGREHAIIKSLIASRKTGLLFAAPGNGGTELDFVKNIPLKATDVEGVVAFAKQNAIDFVVVAPDDPLMLGMVDALEKEGIKAFGPKKNAAIIEGSKVFSKQLMKKYGIPTANFEVFDDYAAACEYVKKHGAPIVVKADGLALGKGVVVAQTEEEAVNALT